MGKIAFVFRSMGDQFPAWKDLYEKYAIAKGFMIYVMKSVPASSSLSAGASEDELKIPEYTALPFCNGTGGSKHSNWKGIVPDVVAGFSRWSCSSNSHEYLTIKQGFDLSANVENWCNARQKNLIHLAAVVKLTPQQVKEVCSKYSDIYPVNFAVWTDYRIRSFLADVWFRLPM